MYIIIGLEKSLDSRSLSLIKTIKSISYSKLIFLKSKNNSILVRLVMIYYHLIMNIIRINFSRKEKIDGIIILFKSHLLYPLSYICTGLVKIKFIVDLGYPFDDHSSYNNIYIKYIYNFLEKKFLNSVNLNLLLESDNQINRLRRSYNNANLYCHYMTESKGLEITSPNNSLEEIYKLYPNLYDFMENNYILFRGRLNYESGIMHIIEEYQKYTSLYSAKIKFVIQGNGKLAEEVNIFLNKYPNRDIIFINDYVGSEQMKLLITKSIGVLGQFYNYNNRLNYTIPNKYFEALKLNKLYITPNWSPLKDPYLKKINTILPIINKNYKLRDWLNDSYDSLINKKSSYSEKIIDISTRCLEWHNHKNQKTFKEIIKFESKPKN